MSVAPVSSSNTLVALPDVTRHSPRVVAVLGQNPSAMTLQGTNTYLLGTGAHRLLVDAAEGMSAYTPILQRVLKEQGVTHLTILLTHWHADHTGGLRAVCDLFDAAHQPTIHKYLGSELIPARVLKAFPDLASRVQPIRDNQQFVVEGVTLRAIHTPGHTADHCVFELVEEQAVLSGDTILGASTAVFADLLEYMTSLRAIAALQPTRIYPAHGPIIDGAEDSNQRIEQYIFHRTQREQQILEAMHQARKDKQHPDGLNALQLVEKIYTSLAPNLLFAAANNVLLHLDKLLKEGKVRVIEDASTPASLAHDHEHTADDEDDCKAEVAKAHAIARQRATWRWQLVHS